MYTKPFVRSCRQQPLTCLQATKPFCRIFTCKSIAGTDRSDAYLWVQQHPQLAALAGNCSLVQSWSVGFVNNYASVAGGAVYSTHMPSLNMTCRDGQKVDVTTGCPPWSNNTVRMCTDPKANATCKLQVNPNALFQCSNMDTVDSLSSTKEMQFISSRYTSVVVAYFMLSSDASVHDV